MDLIASTSLISNIQVFCDVLVVKAKNRTLAARRDYNRIARELGSVL
jgi:hypothetical protein